MCDSKQIVCSVKMNDVIINAWLATSSAIQYNPVIMDSLITE